MLIFALFSWPTFCVVYIIEDGSYIRLGMHFNGNNITTLQKGCLASNVTSCMLTRAEQFLPFCTPPSQTNHFNCLKIYKHRSSRNADWCSCLWDYITAFLNPCTCLVAGNTIGCTSEIRYNQNNSPLKYLFLGKNYTHIILSTTRVVMLITMLCKYMLTLAYQYMGNYVMLHNTTNCYDTLHYVSHYCYTTCYNMSN